MMAHNLHRSDCFCEACCPLHPTDRRIKPLQFWGRLIVVCLLFWAFPGRWLLAAIWAALSPLFTR